MMTRSIVSRTDPETDLMILSSICLTVSDELEELSRLMGIIGYVEFNLMRDNFEERLKRCAERLS